MRRSLQLPPLILNEVREAQDPYEEESPDARAIKRQRTISQAKMFRISTKKLITLEYFGEAMQKQIGLPRGVKKATSSVLSQGGHQNKAYLSTKFPSFKNCTLSDGYSTEGVTSRTISTACTANSSSDDSTSAAT